MANGVNNLRSIFSFDIVYFVYFENSVSFSNEK